MRFKRKYRKIRLKKRTRLMLAALALTALFCVVYQLSGMEPAVGPPAEDISETQTDPAAEEDASGSSFRAVFLDVGEGDACLVQCDGHSMLIDGGPASASQLMYTVLKNEGIDRLDCIVATHPDADHIGGLSGALQYAKTDVAYCTGEERDTKAFRNLVKKLAEQGLELTVPGPGDRFDLGSAEVTVLGPEKGTVYSDNTSIVVRVCYGETSFLFTGDSEKEDEEYLLKSGFELKSTVLKVGHHGSRSSTTQTFLSKVRPEYSVISVGRDCAYGHPTQTVLDRLKASGSRLYRTDLHGSVTCTSDGKTVSFSSERAAQGDIFLGYTGLDFHWDQLVECCVKRIQ